MLTIEKRVDLLADAETVWRHATSLAGINHELWPVVQMTAPPGITDIASADPPIGAPWFGSVLRIGGVLPYDRMQLCVEVLDVDGRRFAERSTMRWVREWRHERRVEAVGAGCRLTDRLDLVPRLPGTGAMVRALFAWRHRRLRALFGARYECA